MIYKAKINVCVKLFQNKNKKYKIYKCKIKILLDILFKNGLKKLKYYKNKNNKIIINIPYYLNSLTKNN
jgi:hypothetical protein